MSLTVASTLTLLNELCDNDGAFILSYHTGGFIGGREPREHAILGMKIIEVSNTRILSQRNEKKKATKVVVLNIDAQDMDYSNPVTVSQFKRFLDAIEDKSIYVCATRTDFDKGWLPNVINLRPTWDNINDKNENLRKRLGDNIVHLWV